jgi:hypothetical protein
MSDFGHFLKVRFGLAPGDPTDEQLQNIIHSVKQFAATNKRDPTIDELGEIVRRHCPSFGRWKYAADVNLELRRQIAQLAAQAKK